MFYAGQPVCAKPKLPSLAAPTLVEPLHDASVNEGDSVRMTCKIHGEPRPMMTWYHNGQPIKPSKYFQFSSTPDGHQVLNIAGAFPEDQGTYKCVARNPQGQIETTAKLTVKGFQLAPYYFLNINILIIINIDIIINLVSFILLTKSIAFIVLLRTISSSSALPPITNSPELHGNDSATVHQTHLRIGGDEGGSGRL